MFGHAVRAVIIRRYPACIDLLHGFDTVGAAFIKIDRARSGEEVVDGRARFFVQAGFDLAGVVGIVRLIEQICMRRHGQQEAQHRDYEKHFVHARQYSVSGWLNRKSF